MSCLTGSQGSSNSTSSQTLDPALRDYLTNVVMPYATQLGNGAGDLLSKQENYSGPLGAGVSQLQQRAFDNSGLGAANQGYFDNAAANINKSVQGYSPAGYTAATGGPAAQASSFGYTASGWDPSGMNAAQIGPASQSVAERAQAYLADAPTLAKTDLSSYMNPFTQNVTNTTLDQLNLNTQRQLMNNSMNAAAQNAWGGSRQGVADALTNEAAQRTAAQTLAGLNQGNFTNAQGAAQQDLSRQLQANLANSGQLSDVSKFNAATGTQNNQFNATSNNQNAITQAQLQQQANAANQQASNASRQFNADATNQQGQFNAGQSQAVSLANQAANNNMAQFGATAQNNANQFNAGATNNAEQFLSQARLNAGNSLSALGTNNQNANLSYLNSLMGMGNSQQATQQNQNTMGYQDFLNNRNFGLQRINTGSGVLSAMNGAPFTAGSTTNKTGSEGQTSMSLC